MLKKWNYTLVNKHVVAIFRNGIYFLHSSHKYDSSRRFFKITFTLFWISTITSITVTVIIFYLHNVSDMRVEVMLS